ncbi:hypothetical protein SCHPADRAFT_910888 [Schizopora paradoxa]|uniref:Auxin efflux carrier n=1 Tax=Schizopora paradoxa TaxID=27342 RepID=A0A0H2R821_9AGAM|nr:hypothetical protein SCHPADRAFT_910888 [Schizopora paradoxa]
MAPVLILLKTVFESILEVFLLCLAGYLLSRRGILDKKTQKQLNRLNVSLFTPSLLFSKVAFFLSPAKLRELWIIPIFFVITTGISMGIAYTLGWIFRLKRSQRSFAVAASMFMNSNSLPIALMQSLVVTVPGLKWDDEDEESSMLGRALTYLVLYSTLGMVLRWSYGVHLLSQADPETQENGVPEIEEEQADETTPLLGSDETDANVEFFVDTPPNGNSSPKSGRPTSVMFIDPDTSRDDLISNDRFQTAVKVRDFGSDQDLAANGGDASPNDSLSVRKLSPSRNRKDPVFYSFPNTPARSQANLPLVSSDDSLVRADDDLLLGARYRQRTTPTNSRLHSFFRRTRHRVKKVLRTINEFMTTPLWAAAASLIVALIQPLQHTLESHVQPFKGALTAAGNCSIPLTLVVLGAYFYTPPFDEKENTSSNGGVLPSTVTSSNTNGEQGNIVSGNGETMERETSRFSFVGSVRSMFSLHRRDSNGNFESGRKFSSNLKAEKGRPGETRTVAIAVISRMLLTPLVLMPLMSLSAKFDIPKIFDDPVFVVSNVLLISSPPALTLAQITQAASGDAFERLISRTIFWAYCVVTPPATIVYVMIGLLMAKL